MEIPAGRVDEEWVGRRAVRPRAQALVIAASIAPHVVVIDRRVGRFAVDAAAGDRSGVADDDGVPHVRRAAGQVNAAAVPGAVVDKRVVPDLRVAGLVVETAAVAAASLVIVEHSIPDRWIAAVVVETAAFLPGAIACHDRAFQRRVAAGVVDPAAPPGHQGDRAGHVAGDDEAMQHGRSA